MAIHTHFSKQWGWPICQTSNEPVHPQGIISCYVMTIRLDMVTLIINSPNNLITSHHLIFNAWTFKSVICKVQKWCSELAKHVHPSKTTWKSNRSSMLRGILGWNSQQTKMKIFVIYWRQYDASFEMNPGSSYLQTYGWVDSEGQEDAAEGFERMLWSW